VLSAGDGWGGRRKTGALADVGRIASQRDKIRESDEFVQHDSPQSNQQLSATTEPVTPEPEEVTEDNVESASLDNWEDDSEIADVGADVKVINGNGSGGSPSSVLAKSPAGLETDSTNGVNGHTSNKPHRHPPIPLLSNGAIMMITRTFKVLFDPSVEASAGLMQNTGPFTPDQLKLWNSSGWLRPNLVMLRVNTIKAPSNSPNGKIWLQHAESRKRKCSISGMHPLPRRRTSSLFR
jgi:hypothetical protein